MSSLVVQMLPGQVSDFWDVIKFAIEESVPPDVGEHPDKMNNILSSILCGNLDVWASYTKDKEGNGKFEGIALTQEVYDESSNTKNLLIYSFYGYSEINLDVWKKLFITVAKLASEKKCNKILAYSNVDKVIDMAKLFGGNADYTFLTFDVKKTVEKLNDLSEV